MLWLTFIYMVVTVIVSGFMLFAGMVWSGSALLMSCLLGFAGGAAMRGAFYLGERTSGIIIGLGLLAAGMGLVFYSDVTLQMFGVHFSREVWVAVGFVVGFLAARPEDAGIDTGHESHDHN